MYSVNDNNTGQRYLSHEFHILICKTLENQIDLWQFAIRIDYCDHVMSKHCIADEGATIYIYHVPSSQIAMTVNTVLQ